MAKTNVKNLGRVLDRLKKAISFLDEGVYLKLGEYVRNRIQSKARSGQTMISGSSKKLKKLSPDYIEYRKKNADKADSEFFSPKRSNLTFTGQYLKSIRVTKISRANRTLFVEPTGTRKDGLTNKKLSGYVAKQGRNIFGMDQTGLKVLKNMLVREIRNSLRKNLLKK